ncbi:MAG TPA: non-ribosomal peptide synthase/polyketide synthase [Thermoanaerobaculia bacterium]|nr:non-ribosomal peptide synthase/polyketide synthase [Thermoanaerobaculia bacterium]
MVASPLLRAPEPSTLVEALRLRARLQPERRAYTFLADGEDEQGHLTWAGLDLRARTIAVALRRSSTPGDRALLLYPPGLDFVAAFFGCLYAGVVAVPAYPPRSPRTLPRLRSILADSRPAVALSTSALSARVGGWLDRHADELPRVSWLATDELDAALAGEWAEPGISGDDLAFLQYTSGSTSAPKGVMVSHANLAHNQRVIQAACDHTEESVFVTWLPVYHDLGLIGNVLQATWVGAPCVMMAPVAFLQNPLRWLAAVSRYRGTTSGGPNFSYDLCARKIPAAERERLDLSSWRVAFNGAEPVRAETLARFTETFAVSGFRSGALYPCYGLAEATLMVSGGRPGQEPVVRDLGGRRLVGCGRILLDLSAAVVDPETGTPSAPGNVGEIWVAGGSVARGYWNRPEETAHAFGALLPDGRGPFLRTGDLGVLSDGELFIAGRLKDLIILRGRNHYPQDLEATAERSHPSLAGGAGAAFSIEEAGEERLVIVHEIERHAADPGEIAEAVRRTVAEEHEAVVHDVVLVRPGGVPRTTSGKIQRRATRELYLTDGLEPVSRSRLDAAAAEAPEAGAPEDWLRSSFAAAARVDASRIDPDRPLTAFGLDSLAAIEWRHAVLSATGVALPMADLLEGMTLREAAERVAAGAPEEREEEAPGAGGPETGEHPLSWGQRSLWFLDRLAPESAAYVIAGAARIVGDGDAETLARAVQGLVDRHPVLRATIASVSGEPVLRVASRAEAGLVRLDASGWSAEEVSRRLHEEAFRPFDLEHGPVLRAALLERGDERLLVLSVHHIAADFWSMAVLARDLGALCRGEDPPRPEALYTDFARRQERRLESPWGERLWEHWRERLSGAPALDLPTDRPRPPLQTFRGGTRTARLGAEAVHALAASHGSTPFVVLLAAFQALLGRWSGQEDFLVGSPTSGRIGSDLDSVVGYFVNPVALRADLSGDPAVGELLARTRATVIDALTHQELPFALLAERLQPDRDPSRPPLVQAMLTFQKAPVPELAALSAFAVGEPGARLDLGGLILESVPLEPPGAQLDLSLMVAETGGGLAASLQWSSDLFDAATAERMLGAFGQLLESMAAERLEILSEAERMELIAAATGPLVPRPAGLLHELVEAQALRTPEAVAVEDDELALTYRELEERANRLAHHLAAMGIGPDARVGVSVERSAGMVVALLGAVKAGGAYVPLDPEYPAERLAAMVEDARPLVVLTGERIEELVSSGNGEPLRRPVPDTALAYLLFTSGSTGRPKGVMVEHRSLVNHMLWMQEELPLGPGDRVLQKTPFGFDASVWEFWAPLMAGATLVMARPGEHRDPAALVRAVREQGITILQVVPSLLSALIEEGLGGCPSLRRVFVGGEALTADLVERFFQAVDAELVDLYGPTETTVEVAVGRSEPGRPVRLGPAIHNARVLVLDRGLGLAPLGVPGEICIGGVPVGRGYFERPAETAERFVPDPFADSPGARLYRTGDLGRRRPDGIEFLGRLDHLVKVRGVRIELGEIEATLARHPEVDQAVVLVREGARLAAYVVGAADPAALRAFLRERLPEAMVPLDWVSLPELPRTPNGKIDRKALALLAPDSSGDEFVAPRTPAEELLAGVFAEVLGVGTVGVRDDFFALGGHSLLATRVVARMREALGVEIPLAAFFASPTVADLAGGLERGSASEAPPLERRSADEAPLSFAQERLWFLDRLTPGLPVYNMPALLRLRGPLDEAALERALAEIARRHEVLRTVFAVSGSEPVQRILPTGFPLSVLDLPETEARRFAEAEARRPFDLTRGPLARAALLRMGGEDHLLLLVFHHIVFDGWSTGVLLGELAALLGSSPLPEPRLQYADYAAWQKSWLAGPVLERQLAWWRDRLAGAPLALDLPADRPRPAVQSFRGAVLPADLPEDLSGDLRALARREGATPFMVLLAGLSAFLHRVTGQDDLVVGAALANRGRAETEGLLGFFVNALPLRAGLADDPPFRALLARTRTEALGAYDHQDVPFERLVEEVAPRRDLSRTPLFQVMLALQSAPRPQVPEVEIEEIHTGTSKFDLSLLFEEVSGRFRGTAEYATDLFDAGTIRRLLDGFQRLLRGAVEAPGLTISELPILSDSERRQVVLEWNRTATAYPREATIHGLFEEQAALRPDAVAVVFGEQSLTYGELDLRAGRLARRLRSRGVGPEVPVGLSSERSLELIVAILGILKAGGAYVPLDPGDPRGLAEDLPVILSPEDLAVDEGEGMPGVPASPDNLAYVMYTSGSTGRPKGVAVTHRNVVRLVRETGYARFGPDEVFLQLAPVSFDASTLEIWGPLLSGGRLAVPPPGAPSFADLSDWIARHGVTTLWLTAGLFHGMVEARLDGLAPVRQLLAGGDVLSPAHVRQALGGLPGTVLINGYGPTEGTTFTCCHRMEDASEVGATVPIGKPVANTRAYVLDRGLRPVPVGVAGGLYAAGDGLARGYSGRPDLTAERFLPNPLGSPGERMYRTGDLARWRPDGTLEFLGRADRQVKIRGFRVEPGEVEAALRAHPAVRDAVVVASPEPSGTGRRLVAYAVTDADPAALQAFLRERLPEPLVPSAFVRLPELPLTPNGKVDRRALPEPEAPLREGSVAPRTPAEEVVAGIWADLLGLEKVGAEDDFFELGGHSLLATRLVARLHEAFGVELPLAALFEEPTVAGVAARLLSAPGETPPIRPVPREGGLPLSAAQERLWFLHQLDPEDPAYNIPLAVRLEGDLDVPALEEALRGIVLRHETLRTTFRAATGQPPVQVIAPRPGFSLPRIDAASAAEVIRLAEEEALRPFDLAADMPLRAVLVRISPREHTLLLTFHHIAADGWSLGVFLGELAALYGGKGDLPPLPVQYADYAVWQRKWLAGEVRDGLLAYWTKALAGAPEALDLPTDRPRSAASGRRGASRTLAVPTDLWRAAGELARRESATPFMVLLAAVQALLSRTSGADDLTVGSPVAGRSRPEAEGLIGLFVNTLVLRGGLAGDPPFSTLLARTRETVLSAYAHQALPFEHLVEALSPERSLDRSPLFQVLLSFGNTPMPPLALPGVTLSLLETRARASKFDLTFLAAPDGEGLKIELVYRAELWEAGTIERMLGHLETLLAGALASPGTRLSDLPLLTGPERREMLVDWNRTGRDFPVERTLGEVFDEQAARTPDALALIQDEAQGEAALTFRELADRVDRLARHLKRLGVGPEVKVGLSAGRSPRAIVGILAIWKAGGVYVPLDPAYPQERLAWTIEDAGIEVLLTDERLDPPGEESEASPGSGAGPDNAAYVIYTSGSTGRPKGVVVRHRSALNLLHALGEGVYGETGPLRVGVNASFAFDGSIKQIVQILAGHTLVVVPDEARLDPAALAELIRHHRLDVLDCTPSQLGPLLEAGLAAAPEGAPALVLVGGEAVPREIWELARSRSWTRFVNVYGPTECTVDATALDFAAAVAPAALGRPLANVRIYRTDSTGQPVPAGVPGEIRIGGAGLARGYLNRPGLTAERFVPDPSGEEPGGRLYRTGDLARLLPDGTLEYLGRIDHQVKVRGVRVEPGEIEEALVSHPGVDHAVVVVREDGGGPRLVAYVVPKADGAVAPEPLRGFLADRLPAFLVPAAFVLLESLPLTPNGKIDRRALPAPGAAAAPGAALRTPAEELAAGILADVLGLDRMGADGNFFELGGHSLLATRAVSRLAAAFAVDLPLRALFEAPTVAELAARIELLRGERTPAPPPLHPVSREEAPPLSFAQERLWFLDQMEPGSPAYNIPAAVSLRGGLRPEILAAALSEAARRHEALRTTFRAVDGVPCQWIAPPSPVDLPVIDLADLPEEARREEAARLADREARRPFDLFAGPLLRAVLLRLAGREHTALVTVHHIVSDGWSTGVLVHELAVLYEAFAAGSPPPLPELPVQYADFAVWQRIWLQGDALKAELAWWTDRLAGAPRVLELPADRPRPVLPSHRGRHLPVGLDAEVARALRELSRRRGVTLFMTVKAGFDALLSRYTGETDLLVGSPVANRSRPELFGLIGFFANTLVLRGELAGDPTFEALLGRTRETALGAFEHQDLPFEKLVQELSPERSPGRSPLIQVVFALQNAPAAAWTLPGLELVPLPVESGTAKFDLTLLLRESGGELGGLLESAADLFDEATIARLAGHFEALLAGAAAHPGTRLSDLPLLSGAEAREILAGAESTRSEYPREMPIHRLFEEQAALHPERVALVLDDEEMTYGELDRRANGLAWHLLSLGIAPETLVGVALDRSPGLVVAFLGILKAGGAYVPLDPADPAARRELLLEEAGVSLVVTEETLRAEARSDAPPAVPADALAYVLFTSGSTGKPKAVGVPHRAVVRLVRGADYADFGPEQVFLQLAPAAFDASTLEIWGPLLSGGRLVLFPPRTPSLAELEEALARHGVTTLWLTAGLFHQVVESRLGSLRGLSQLLAGGDVLSPAAVNRVLAELPGCALINGYGPTENTTFTCCHTVRAPIPPGASVPIGRPIANTRVHVLDAAFRPVPDGVPGELFAGGDGLARGYLGRPELTAERFVPDPSGEPGARLYRTGDRARRRPGGEIEFLGRIDQQVKIRGFRVEPGEVEAALARHPGVREAVVAAGEDGAGARRLVAYVVPAEGPGPASSELRSFLREILPDPLVPAAFVAIPEIPLTPNGKVDRRALPAPGAAAAAREYVAPRNAVEEILAEIWAEALGVERVGAEDDFFELGGHSLLAVRLTSRVYDVLGIRLPVRAVFDAPTLGELAETVAEEIALQAGAEVLETT